MSRSQSITIALVAMLFSPGLSAAADPQPFPPGEDFGVGLTLEDVTPLSEVVANPDRFEGTPVLVRGRITDVCQRKGCWTVITDDSVSVRVRFHDYGFFLPKDSTSRTAMVEGLVKTERLTEKSARHYASESASNAEESSPIEGDRQVVGFTATGVRLLAQQ